MKLCGCGKTVHRGRCAWKIKNKAASTEASAIDVAARARQSAAMAAVKKLAARILRETRDEVFLPEETPDEEE